MADNANDKTQPKTVDDAKALASAITTEQVRAIVEDVLHKGGYVTAETVTRLMDKQTLTFQATVGGLRDELSGQIKGLRAEFTDEMKHWRSTIRGIDDRGQQLLSQNIEVLKLSSNIQGQNAQIAETLNRFSNRLDDISEDMDTRLKTSLTEFNAAIRETMMMNAARIDKLQADVDKNTSFRAKREQIEQAVAKYAGGLLKHTGFRWAVGVGATALLSYIGYSAATNSNVLFELARILGGG